MGLEADCFFFSWWYSFFFWATLVGILVSTGVAIKELLYMWSPKKESALPERMIISDTPTELNIG